MIVCRFDPEEDLVREPMHIDRMAAEACRVKLLGQLEECLPHFFCGCRFRNTQRGIRALRDAHLHLGEHGAGAQVFLTGHCISDRSSNVWARKASEES